MSPTAAIFAPGLFASSAVRLAALVGVVVAAVAGGWGTFTVIRGQAFAGEGLADVGTAGGASAYLAGVGPLWGFLVAALGGAAAMELVGVQRIRGRDLATGVVLGAGFGLSALFLYLGTTAATTTGAASTILFGSIFTLDSTDLPLVLGLAGLAVVLLAVLHRPLLLASVSSELAAARGLPVRRLGIAYLLAVALTVALAALTVGSILSTALLIGPAAAAFRLTDRPGRAMVLAAGLGAGCVLVGIVLAYDSYTWPPLHHGWPASFFIVCLVLVAYLGAGVVARLRGRR